MKKTSFTPVLLTIAALLGACSSMPKTTSLLDQTHSDYQAAQNNPKVVRYAPLEMKQAGEAMEKADTSARAHDSSDQIDRLAYLAKQQIALTQEVAKQKSAEADVASAGKERDQVRLAQRTNEADQAKVSAEESRLAARMAETDSAEAQRQTLMARSSAAEAERQMQAAQARTATLEAQLADLAAKKTERGIVITLGDVLFGTDLARLNSDGLHTAQKLATVLQQNPTRTVLVEGFTDSTGSAAHNQDLSERRASAVRSALLDLGVARERISIRGYGETHPVAANDTKENRQLNRRVEIILSGDNGQIAQR
jgi:outer membrane protein OmpA-like peptidoglycan-associated protein